MPEDIFIYVDNTIGVGNDNNDGTLRRPVLTADEAFSRLPSSWRGRAEIIFKMTDTFYPIETRTLYLGTPIGLDASPLVIRAGELTPVVRAATPIRASAASTGDYIDIAWRPHPDIFLGYVLKRASGTGSPIGTAVSVRGNSDAGRVYLQRNIGTVAANELFIVEVPRVTLTPMQTLNITSSDSRSLNLTLVGITVAPMLGQGLNLFNVRAQCDTCEFRFARDTSATVIYPSNQWSPFYIHTNSRIQGGIADATLSPDLDARREAAGVYIHCEHATDNDNLNFVWAVRGGVLGGHLTFRGVAVRVSQGGVFTPKSLEALEAPIHIMAGGLAIGEPSWGTPTNKARIRNVRPTAGATPGSPAIQDGDGLRILNGGSAQFPAPVHLDVSGCNRDGIRLDGGSLATFALPGQPAGLVTAGALNGQFGMNVRNGSRALVGSDADRPLIPPDATPRPLKGDFGDVALDGTTTGDRISWSTVTDTMPAANGKLSLVRRNI